MAVYQEDAELMCHTLCATSDNHIVGRLQIFALPFGGCYGLLRRVACEIARCGTSVMLRA